MSLSHHLSKTRITTAAGKPSSPVSRNSFGFGFGVGGGGGMGGVTGSVGGPAYVHLGTGGGGGDLVPAGVLPWNKGPVGVGDLMQRQPFAPRHRTKVQRGT